MKNFIKRIIDSISRKPLLVKPVVMPPLPSVKELREISKDRPNTFMNGALYIIDLIEQRSNEA